jgi:hypothetical protein
VTTANASSAGSKTIHVFDAVVGALGRRGFGGVQHVVITGGIGDYGTTQLSTAAGKLDRTGNYLKFTLTHGTFLARSTNDKSHLSKWSPQCTITDGFSSDYVLSHGTGRYADITGSLDASKTLAEVKSKVTSGPDKGQCSRGADTQGEYYSTLVAHGTVTL